MSGSVALAATSALSVKGLRNSVTSKNGTTAAGLTALMQDAQLDALLEASVSAAYQRAIALR